MMMNTFASGRIFRAKDGICIHIDIDEKEKSDAFLLLTSLVLPSSIRPISFRNMIEYEFNAFTIVMTACLCFCFVCLVVVVVVAIVAPSIGVVVDFGFVDSHLY